MKNENTLSSRVVWVLDEDPGARFVYDEILGPRCPVRLFARLDPLLRELDGAIRKPHLLIADLSLRGTSLTSFFSSENARALSEIPLIVVSSVDDLGALRHCFENGAAFDYLTKPFGKAELILKVERAF